MNILIFGLLLIAAVVFLMAAINYDAEKISPVRWIGLGLFLVTLAYLVASAGRLAW